MINTFLTKHKITQYRLAKLLNVTQSTIARWREKGPANPTILEMALETLELRMRKAQTDTGADHLHRKSKGE